MADSAISVTYVEEGEEHQVKVPRLDMEPEQVIKKLSHRFPQRRFTGWSPGRSQLAESRSGSMSPTESKTVAVEDIMASPVITTGLDTEVHELIELMQENRIRHLPVLEGGRLRGILSDRDVLGAMSPFIGKMAERPADAATLRGKAHQLMTREVITIHRSASLCLASTRMEANRIHCLPVVEDGELVGIITATDLLAALSVSDAGGHLGVPP